MSYVLNIKPQHSKNTTSRSTSKKHKADIQVQRQLNQVCYKYRVVRLNSVFILYCLRFAWHFLKTNDSLFLSGTSCSSSCPFDIFFKAKADRQIMALASRLVSRRTARRTWFLEKETWVVTTGRQEALSSSPTFTTQHTLEVCF